MLLLLNRIQKETGELLSVQTLNRFFGLIKSDFAPSADTLNILCRFLGYAGYAEFSQITANQNVTLPNDGEPEILLLQALLSDLNTANPQDPSMFQLFRNVFKICNLKSGLWNQLYSRFAAFQVGQGFLFEQFINMDALDGHYGNGLGYYLLHANKPMQQVFGHGLLMQRYFLNGNNAMFRHHHNTLQQLYAGRNFSMHRWTAGQFFAAEIYTAAVNGMPLPAPEYLLSKAAMLDIQQHNYPSFPCIEYLLGEAYVLAGAFHEAYQVLASVAYNELVGHDGFDKGYEVQYRILRLLSGYCSGAKSRQLVQAQFEELKVLSVHFLSFNYFGLFKNMLRMALSCPSVKMLLHREIEEQVERTGFIRFRNLVSLMVSNKTKSLMENNG